MLSFVEKFEPGARAQVLARMSDEAREALEGGSRTAWLPIEHDHWVVDGVVQLFGRANAIRCWRDSLPDMVDKPLLRSFVSGMLRVFGNDPARIMSLLPKAWPLIYHDFCELELVQEQPNQLEVLFKRIAPQVRQYPNYLHSWDGVLQGVFALAKVPGSVSLTVAADYRSARAICTWE